MASRRSPRRPAPTTRDDRARAQPRPPRQTHVTAARAGSPHRGVWAVAWGTLDSAPVLASAGGDGTVRLWDPADGGLVLAVVWGTLDSASVLVSTGIDGTVRLWDPSRPRAAVIKLEESLFSVSISPDGWLAIAGWGGTGRARDPPRSVRQPSNGATIIPCRRSLSTMTSDRERTSAETPSRPSATDPRAQRGQRITTRTTAIQSAHSAGYERIAAGRVRRIARGPIDACYDWPDARPLG
ncbi:MAG: WD40 repeat domain-containing protein [Egibacteraceae bacterium]